MRNANNWRRVAANPCACGCGVLVAKVYKKGHGRRRPLAVRFARHFVEGDGCWVWTGATDANGYGRFGIGGTVTALAHRVAFELFVGPIPDGLHVDHMCRNRACVRPAHLEAITQAENNRRARLTAAEHFALAAVAA